MVRLRCPGLVERMHRFTCCRLWRLPRLLCCCTVAVPGLQKRRLRSEVRRLPRLQEGDAQPEMCASCSRSGRRPSMAGSGHPPPASTAGTNHPLCREEEATGRRGCDSDHAITLPRRPRPHRLQRDPAVLGWHLDLATCDSRLAAPRHHHFAALRHRDPASTRHRVGLPSTPKPTHAGARPAYRGCADSRPWMAGGRLWEHGRGESRGSTPPVRRTGCAIPQRGRLSITGRGQKTKRLLR